MKYTKDQFNRVLICFEDTTEVAKLFGKTCFICFHLYDDYDALLKLKPCKKYCPFYNGLFVKECTVHHDAAYWQFAKEKFIIENEPQD